MKTETVNQRGVKPAPSVKETQTSEFQLPLPLSLAALSCGGLLEEESMDRIIEEHPERGEMSAQQLRRVVKTWIEGDDEPAKDAGAAQKEPDEFERFVAGVGEHVATCFEFGCRVTIAKRGRFYYNVIEALALPFDGGYLSPEEIEAEKGEEYLAALWRETPASEVRRNYDFEPISRGDVADWMRRHILPTVIPAEFIGDFKTAAASPLPVAPKSVTPKNHDRVLDGKRSHFSPTGLYGAASRQWEVPQLACAIAMTLADHRDFIRRAVLDSLDEREPFAVCRAGEFAEILLIAAQAEKDMDSGFTWDREQDFVTPGLAAPDALSAAEFLESAALASHWAWEGLAKEALASLPSSKAIGLLEALCVLEAIGDDWAGLATDLEKSNPSKLMRAVGKARLTASFETAA